VIIMRYGIFTVAEEYFETVCETPRVDVLRYRLVASPENLRNVEPQSTVTIDLTQPESVIFQNFDKATRYEIRRAESKDLIECVLLNSHEITESSLAQLESNYRGLVKIKGVTPINMQRLSLLQEQGKLFLGKATMPDGTALAWHVYLVAHRRARLLHSLSLFRDTQQSAQRQLVGRANRLLHWNDIIEFKNAGIELYDFGGYFQGNIDKGRLQINQFKDEFHGVLRTEFNGFRFFGARGFIVKIGLLTIRLFTNFSFRKYFPGS